MTCASSGGALIDKTLVAAIDLIANMVVNYSQQSCTKLITSYKGVNEVKIPV